MSIILPTDSAETLAGGPIVCHTLHTGTVRAIRGRGSDDTVTSGAHQLSACDADRHRVAFYRSESELTDVAVGTFHDALRRGEPVLVIATAEHRRALRAGLSELVDTESATAAGQLTMQDAREVLSGFMVNGCPDAARFEATVGDLVRRIVRRGHGLSAFGEMVALLWDDGMPHATLAVEQLWNDLQERHSFTLLCAYPAQLVMTDGDPSGYIDIGSAHSSIVCGPPSAADAEVVRHFPALTGSPRLVRVFIRTTLQEWGLAHLVDDAMLVATELATNAIRHARSDFAVSLARSRHGVRLAVGDTRSDMATSRPADDDTDGRGLHLIAATAREWGHHRLDSGKLVWAEIGAPPEVAER